MFNTVIYLLSFIESSKNISKDIEQNLSVKSWLATEVYFPYRQNTLVWC